MDRTTPAQPLGPYSLTRCLGEGGMGAVWAAEHRDTKTPVAVKLLKGQLGDDAWFQRAFLAEVRAVAALDHPNIVTLLDHGTVEQPLAAAGLADVALGSPWLAMEHLPGANLNRAKGRTDWPGFVRILRGLLDALAHAHARGVLHRDIKPANVIDLGDRVVLLDFGLARLREEAETLGDTGVVVGTATYMAPEQFRGQDAEYGPWTDLYAVGALGWALLTGRGPFGQRASFTALAQAHCSEPLPRLAARHPVPPEAEAFLRRMLEKDPQDRFRFAADARAALDRIAAAAPGLALPEPPPALPLPAPRQPREWPVHRHQRPPRLLAAGLRLFGLRRVPLVGRRAEQELLWEALREAGRGLTPVVLLRGPAGTGKSRLVRWLTEAAHAAGVADSLWALHGEEPGAADGLGPAIARALRCSGAAPEAAVERLGRLAQRWGLAPAEARALGLLVAGGDTGRTGFSSAGERHAAALDALRQIAGDRPLIVVLDDVQWGADALSFALHLLNRPVAERPPVVLVLTSRELSPGTITDQLLSRVMAAPDARSVELGPLPPGHRSRMVQEHLQVSGQLATAIEERTEGNPLFMVQLVQDWVRRGLLVPEGERFVLRRGADPRLPRDLREVWRTRVEQALAGRSLVERQSVELAAILGMFVDMREWLAAGREAGCWPSLELVEELLSAGLVEPGADGPEASWRFVHGMLREALVQEAELSGWAQTARRACAEVLAAQLDRGADARAALRLGRLLLDLGEHEAAIAPLSEGAWACVRDSEYLRAELVLADRERAMAAARVASDDRRWGEGWLMEARVARRRGDRDRAQRCTHALVERSRRHGWDDLLCQGLREASRLSVQAGRYRRARSQARDALDIARRRGEALPLAWCRRDLGLLVLAAGGRLRKVDPLLAAAQVAFEAEGEGFGAATCMRARGELRLRENHLKDAHVHLAAARRAFRRSLRVQEPAHSQVGLGDVARLLGNRAEARRWYRAARERFDEIGHPGPPRLAAHLAVVHVDLGDLDAGLELVRGALGAQVRAGSPELLQLLYVVQARVAAARGDGRQVLRQLAAAEAETAAPEGPDPEALIQLERLARDAVEKGDHAISERAWEAAVNGWLRLDWGWRVRLLRQEQARRRG